MTNKIKPEEILSLINLIKETNSLNVELSLMKGKSKKDLQKIIHDQSLTIESLLATDSLVKMIKARKFINRFGSPDFSKFLDETGFGNHHSLIELMAKCFDQTSEG